MADLVIKPTSAGSVILKDDQNVARATIAASTGATTLSNLNFSGGSVGSNVTMPAGAVVKVTQFDIGQYYWSMGDDANNKANYQVMIGSPYWPVVLKQANSKILINVSMTAGGWSSHGYFDIKRGGTSGTWLGAEDGMYGEHRTTGEYHLLGVFGWLDNPGTNAAGTTITYVPYVGQYDSTETFAINRYYNNTNQDTKSKAVFTEIAV
tara:strand:+ start:302 stop:925 length:624 start_codon:yes stop_codon:yes gene_type:complete